MSTLISLLVVGVAGAVVLWMTVGDFAQPATKGTESAGGDDATADDLDAEADPGAPAPFDQDAAVDEPVAVAVSLDADVRTGADDQHPFDQDAVATLPVATAVAAPPVETVEPLPDAPDALDATRPAEGTVPQAAPSRPAEPVAADRPRTRSRRTVALRGSYSFVPAPPITWARRLRSALGVVLMVTAVGLALAASVGVLVVFVSQALEGAVN